MTPQREAFDAAGARAAVLEIESRHPFSGSILVLRKGHILLEMTIGDADRAKRRHAQLDTRYRISDLTGLFTWIGLLQLSDRGTLDLDGSVCAAFRPCPKAWAPLRPRDLMPGRSGLHPVARSELASWPPTLAQYAEVLRSKPLFFRPGSRFAPNTSPYYGGASGSFLAARLLEVASHQSWFAYVEANILRRAGMTATSFAPSADDAIGYGRAKSGAVVQRPLPQPSVEPPVDGGMWSTVRDFARLHQALDDGRLLSRKWLAVLDSPASPGSGSFGHDVGCCWIVSTLFGHPSEVIGAHGFGDGFYTIVERFPADDVLTLVFTNLGGSGVFPAANLLSAFALGEYPAAVAIAPTRLASLAGTYGNGDIVIQVVKGRLTVVRGYDPLPGPLIPTSESTFVPAYAPDAALTFQQDANGNATAVTIRWQNGHAQTLPRQGGR